jgi:hypothetical protein
MHCFRLDPDVPPGDMVRVMDIPSLLTFVVVLSLILQASLGINLFLQMFNLPSLSLLLLKKLTISRWCEVADVFRRGGVKSYPKLTSLNIADMEEIIPS